jgi:double-stranded uracil-DNA glycosylase
MAHRPHRPTRAELRAAHDRTVDDVIVPGLSVLFCGINPGLYSAATGHHFARPGNRFWGALHNAGFTERELKPWEERRLLTLGYGITNMVQRATAAASELRKDEFIAGRHRLEALIGHYRPAWLAVVGIGAYRSGFGRPHAEVGRQPDTIGRTRIWLLPSTSGLNANYQKQDLAREFRKLQNELG